MIVTPSMFVYLIWNKNGKDLKAMLEYKKALQMELEMSKLGVNPQIVFESSCAPKRVTTEKIVNN